MPSKKMRFVDLFAGLGGFHLALRRLGHECVFACESDPELQELYKDNFGFAPAGDLRAIDASDVPSHDVLCAGFPCQPFSKAGEQQGTNCVTSGDLFSNHVLRILRHHKPAYVIFENVPNLVKHNNGSTWQHMKMLLETQCGYEVQTSLLSPHQYGVPQIRERLFVAGSRTGLDGFSWPPMVRSDPDIRQILDVNPADAKPLSDQHVRCLDTWNEFIQAAPETLELPSFPIWSMEFGATYPYAKYDSLGSVPLPTLRKHKGSFGRSLNLYRRKDILKHLPSYARSPCSAFPLWKQQFIQKNRQFYRQNIQWIKPWIQKVQEFPTSHQKFEWNCKGETRDVWKYIIQFRASGVRTKRPTTSPSLVAMTTTQVPIIAWERRYMTPRECARLQCMDELHHFPKSPSRGQRALGNAVNVRVVELIAQGLLSRASRPFRRTAA